MEQMERSNQNRATGPSSASRFLRRGSRALFEQPFQRVRSLCTLTLPIFEALPVDFQGNLARAGIERADILDEAAVPRVALISNDNAVERDLLRAVSG